MQNKPYFAVGHQYFVVFLLSTSPQGDNMFGSICPSETQFQYTPKISCSAQCSKFLRIINCLEALTAIRGKKLDPHNALHVCCPYKHGCMDHYTSRSTSAPLCTTCQWLCELKVWLHIHIRPRNNNGLFSDLREIRRGPKRLGIGGMGPRKNLNKGWQGVREN